ncbi:MAG: hypothetical protein HUJ93_01825 [Bacteroidales bacterium]|nr:hypothetical protein [Bacteroidales bacterium]
MKKVLVIFATLVLLGLLAGYFYHVGKYAAMQEYELTCSAINVVVRDSAENPFIKSAEIADMLKSRKGEKINTLATGEIEKMLVTRSAIKSAQAYIAENDVLQVEVTQHQPVARFEKDGYHFYVSESGYAIPLVKGHALNLPVVTGNIPLGIEGGFRGDINDKSGWARKMLSLTEYIRHDPYWSREVEQIFVTDKDNITLYNRSGDFKVLFGSLTSYQDKFERLGVFYKDIMPQKRDSVREVDLRFRNQIVCR